MAWLWYSSVFCSFSDRHWCCKRCAGNVRRDDIDGLLVHSDILSMFTWPFWWFCWYLMMMIDKICSCRRCSVTVISGAYCRLAYKWPAMAHGWLRSSSSTSTVTYCHQWPYAAISRYFINQCICLFWRVFSQNAISVMWRYYSLIFVAYRLLRLARGVLAGVVAYCNVGWLLQSISHSIVTL